MDVPKPFKNLMPDYEVVEAKLMKVIAAKFDITWPVEPLIKRIDAEVLLWEWDNLVLREGWVYKGDPEIVQRLFLNELDRLM